MYIKSDFHHAKIEKSLENWQRSINQEERTDEYEWEVERYKNEDDGWEENKNVVSIQMSEYKKISRLKLLRRIEF